MGLCEVAKQIVNIHLTFMPMPERLDFKAGYILIKDRSDY